MKLLIYYDNRINIYTYIRRQFLLPSWRRIALGGLNLFVGP